jgi:cystathionine gamma-synthase
MGDAVKFETLSVHMGRDVDASSGAVSAPLHLSTTFERDADGGYSRGYSYIRADNPTRRALEQCIASLEGGGDATCFSSGVAASLAVFSLLRPGERIVAPIEAYHGTGKQLRDLIAPTGVACTFVDMTNLAAVEAALQTPARLVWLETPSNPMLNISDIAAITALAHRQGALVCCDNTFATPVWQRPLQLGADLVMHSATKYFSGHSDAMGGAVITRERGPLADRLHDYQATAGSVPAPFDCWLIRRSLATLACRVRVQTQAAQRIAQFLSEHDGVTRVLYPGLASHPGHAIAQRQMQGGFGGVLSFCTRGGREEAFAVGARTKLFTRATSFGGVESLLEHRASIEGPHTVSPQNLLRLSVGLEHVDDLIADLDQALA